MVDVFRVFKEMKYIVCFTSDEILIIYRKIKNYSNSLGSVITSGSDKKRKNHNQTDRNHLSRIFR